MNDVVGYQVFGGQLFQQEELMSRLRNREYHELNFHHRENLVCRSRSYSYLCPVSLYMKKKVTFYPFLTKYHVIKRYELWL